MSTFKKFSIVAVAAFALGLLTVGCSDDEQGAEKRPVMQQMAEAVAESVATNVTEAAFAKAELPEVEEPIIEEPVEEPSALGDFEAPSGQLVTIGNKTYSAAGSDLTIYNWDTKTNEIVTADAPIKTVAIHAEKVYVGGEKLYVLEDSLLVEVDTEIEGPISSLLSFKYRLLVGTDNGLYSRSVFGDENLLPDVAISTLATDDLGVWVGTDGDGLFRWNGVDFKPRFLARDESLMAHVTALDFGKNHLYVGTPNGLFIYDGGRWEELTEENGLPSRAITAIDASYWVVAIGTNNGVVTYFKKEFSPVKQLEQTTAAAVSRVNTKLLVQADDGALLYKAGAAVRPLITPDPLKDTDVFSGLSE